MAGRKRFDFPDRLQILMGARSLSRWGLHDTREQQILSEDNALIYGGMRKEYLKLTWSYSC